MQPFLSTCTRFYAEVTLEKGYRTVLWDSILFPWHSTILSTFQPFYLIFFFLWQLRHPYYIFMVLECSFLSLKVFNVVNSCTSVYVNFGSGKTILLSCNPLVLFYVQSFLSSSGPLYRNALKKYTLTRVS